MHVCVRLCDCEFFIFLFDAIAFMYESISNEKYPLIQFVPIESVQFVLQSLLSVFYLYGALSFDLFDKFIDNSSSFWCSIHQYDGKVSQVIAHSVSRQKYTSNVLLVVKDDFSINFDIISLFHFSYFA